MQLAELFFSFMQKLIMNKLNGNFVWHRSYTTEQNHQLMLNHHDKSLLRSMTIFNLNYQYS